MAKINAALEKRERNSEYADKFKKKKVHVPRGTKVKKPEAKYSSWCRTKGHPPDCSCGLPAREEIVALRHR